MTNHRALPTWLIATLLFVAACGLRLPGHDHGLPHRSEPDTYVVDQAAGLEQRGLFSRHDAAWKYPLFIATLVAAVPMRTPLPPAADAPSALEGHLAVAAGPHAHARLVIALFSALIAPATYLLARAFLSRRWSALAGLLAASSLLHLCFSLQARPHAPASVTTIFALVACVRFARDPRVLSGLLLGLGCGLAVASLHTGVLTLAPAFVALVIGARKVGRRVIGPGALALALLLGAAAWAYVPGERMREARARDAAQPAVVQTSNDGLEVAPEAPALRFSDHVIPWSTFNGAGFRATAEALIIYDPVLFTVGALGVVFIAARARRRTLTKVAGSSTRDAALVLAAYWVPALCIYGVYARTQARFVLALVPLVALCAVCGIAGLARFLGVRWTPALVAASLTVALVPALRLAWLRVHPDTVTSATAWLTESAAEGAFPEVLCLNLQSVPLLQAPGYAHPDAIWLRSRWERYQAELAMSEKGLAAPTAQRFGVPLRYPSANDIRALWVDADPVATARAMLTGYAPEVVVLGTSLPATGVPQGTRRALAAAREVVKAPEYELLDTFDSSIAGGLDADVGYQTIFGVVLRARALGPRIEVWRRTKTGAQR